MNSLPDDIQDTMYKYKHQLEFTNVIDEMIDDTCDIEYHLTKPIGWIRHPVFRCRHCGVAPWKACEAHCTTNKDLLELYCHGY